MQNSNVLIHCLAGMSRSVTIVIAYIMSVTPLTLEETLNLVKSVRPTVCPNSGFRKQLQEFQANRVAEERLRIKETYFGSNLEFTDVEHCKNVLEVHNKI
jgi:atypical dual specificity phosphatase